MKKNKNIVLPETQEEFFTNLVSDIAKMQLLMNELVVRYNGLVNLLIGKEIINGDELQQYLQEEVKKLQSIIQSQVQTENGTGTTSNQVNNNGGGNIIVP